MTVAALYYKQARKGDMEEWQFDKKIGKIDHVNSYLFDFSLY